MRPIYPGAQVSGSAVTVLLHPGDNWMLHVAAEQIRPGDIVVAAVTAPSSDGFFGDLLATSFQARGARALVIDGGVRDVRDAAADGLLRSGASAISSKGCVKATLGSVNMPVVCAGMSVQPGDVIVADDDGVVVRAGARWPRPRSRRRASARSLRRSKREKLASGVLGLDMYDMRPALAAAGLRYID